MPILNLQFVKQMTGANVQELLFNAAKESMTLSRGKTLMHFSGEEISSLPKVFQDLVAGLKQPTITIGNKTAKGQSLWGLAVKDGEKQAEKFALSLDTTRGTEPIYQYRHQAFLEGEKFLGEHRNMDLAAQEINSEATISSFTIKDGITEFSVENGKSYSLNKQLNDRIRLEHLKSDGSGKIFPCKMTEEFQQEILYDETAKRITQQREAFHVEIPQILKKFTEISTMDLATVERELVEHKKSADALEKEILDMYAKLKGQPKESLNVSSVISDVIDGIPVKNEKVETVLSITKELRDKITKYDYNKRVLYTLNQKKVLFTYGLDIPDSRIIEILKEINAKIPKYNNKTTIKKLIELKEKSKSMSIESVTHEVVNIICKELGLNPKLLKIQFLENETCMTFDQIKYSISVNPKIYSEVDFENYASFLRHELQHAADFSQLARNKGLNNYKQILNFMSQNQKFDEGTWKKALKQIKKRKINIKKYEGGMLYYNLPDFKRSLNDIDYYSNLYEMRAYREQFAMITALKGTVTNSIAVQRYMDTVLAKELDSKLMRLYKILGENIEQTLNIYNTLFSRSFSVASGLETSEALINHWKALIKLLDEQIVNLEKAKLAKKRTLNVQT